MLTDNIINPPNKYLSICVAVCRRAWCARVHTGVWPAILNVLFWFFNK